nr:polysaccharide biosynthesis C-terminal domain-containing protein [Virgibacillus natechei]
MNLIILASLFHGLKSYYFDLTLQISAKTKYFFYPVLTAVILNVILNIYMLNKYGIEGAALATTISFFVAMLISAYYSIKNYRVPFPWWDFLKVVTSSTIMYLFIINITFENSLLALVSKVLAGCFVYILLSFIMNSLNIRELVMNKIAKR